MSRFPLRACTVAVIAASLTGCQYLGSKFTDEKIQYESTTSRAPLEIPPDLSQLPMDDRFTVPGKTQTQERFRRRCRKRHRSGSARNRRDKNC